MLPNLTQLLRARQQQQDENEGEEEDDGKPKPWRCCEKALASTDMFCDERGKENGSDECPLVLLVLLPLLLRPNVAQVLTPILLVPHSQPLVELVLLVRIVLWFINAHWMPRWVLLLSRQSH